MKNYEQIKRDILSRINNISTIDGSMADVIVSPASLQIEKLHNLTDYIYSQIFLENLSSEDLERKSGDYGLERKPGTKSTGKVTITALNGIIIEKDTLVSTTTKLNYYTTKTIEFTDKEIEVDIIAGEIGERYNVKANLIDNFPISINGAISVVNNTETKVGTNTETDKELLDRLLLQLRTPATSGNKLHYKLWAKEVPGIGDAKVFSLWAGNGTVQVIPITTNKRAPSLELITDVVTKIEKERPLGATVKVTAPIEKKIDIVSTVETRMNSNILEIEKEFENKVEEYIKESVFTTSIVDYNKVLSIFYTIENIKTVTNLKINGLEKNILIAEKEIQFLNTVKVTEV